MPGRVASLSPALSRGMRPPFSGARLSILHYTGQIGPTPGNFVSWRWATYALWALAWPSDSPRLGGRVSLPGRIVTEEHHPSN